METFLFSYNYTLSSSNLLYLDLLIKIDGKKVEPFVEAFGQNLEMISLNKTAESSPIDTKPLQNSDKTLTESNDVSFIQSFPGILNTVEHRESGKLLDLVSKRGDIDRLETILTKDVEQGKCASFKKSELNNEKRSINEPKHSPVSKIKYTNIFEIL